MANREQPIQPVEKREVTADAEQTRPGVFFSPAVDIFENLAEITVLADMPGVTANNLLIDLRDRVLTLEGRVDTPSNENQEVVTSEYTGSGTFLRKFTLSDAIDQARIDATLTDGVLRVTLPKIEEAKPRQIAVKTS